MNIKGVINSVILGTAALLPGACVNEEGVKWLNSRENLLKELMADKPQVELDNIKSHLLPSNAGVTDLQHRIDSVAFRDMFQGSQLAENSDFVADYNKMMTKTKTPAYCSYGILHADNRKLKKILKEPLTDKEMKNVMKSSALTQNGGKSYCHTDIQYLVDSVYHHKLFEKYNLLDEKGLTKFRNLCRKVRP